MIQSRRPRLALASLAAAGVLAGASGCAPSSADPPAAAPPAAAAPPPAAASNSTAGSTTTSPGGATTGTPDTSTGAPTGAPTGTAVPAGPGPTGAADTPALTAQNKPSPPGQLHRHRLSFTTGAQPKQVAFRPDGRELWITPLVSSAGVEVYDAATGRRTARIKIGKHGAVEVIFTRDGRTAYVSQMETGSVYAIDTATKQVSRRYATQGVWTKVLALSPDERTIYAANWSTNDVSAIDLATGSLRRYPTVRTPRGLFVHPDGKRLYVAGYEDGEIARVDLDTGKGTVLVRTGGAMRHLVGDPTSGLVYADDMSKGTVFVLDPATDKVRPLADTDENPNTIDLSPDGRVLYVSNRGRNGSNWYKPGPQWGSVLAIDTATGKHLDAIVGGNQTTGLDVSPDGSRLAYTDFLDDTLTVYEVPAYDVLAAGRGGRYAAHRADLAK